MVNLMPEGLALSDHDGFVPSLGTQERRCHCNYTLTRYLKSKPKMLWKPNTKSVVNETATLQRTANVDGPPLSSTRVLCIAQHTGKGLC